MSLLLLLTCQYTTTVERISKQDNTNGHKNRQKQDENLTDTGCHTYTHISIVIKIYINDLGEATCMMIDINYDTHLILKLNIITLLNKI